jgi:hypothetical protein
MGCGERTSPEVSATTLTDSAGVTIVRNDLERLTRGCIALETALVIQSNAGALRTSPLFDVRGGAVLSDGRIAVLNRGSKQLLYFGADGDFLEAVGGEGRGPGELTDPRWLGHGTNDTLLIWDRALARLSSFDGNGTFLSASLPQGSGAAGGSASIVGRFDDGSLLTRPGPLAFFPSPTGVLRLSESYDRYDPASGTGNHIVDGRSIEWAVGDRGRYTRPFGKEDIAVAAGDRLLIGDNGTSAIRVYDLQGRLDRVLEWSSEAAPVTRQDQARFVRYMREEFPRVPLALNPDFPGERPRFSTIVADELNWIWVELYAAEWEPPAPWLVFDQSGVVQCEVRFPESIRVLEIAVTHVLGYRRENSGEESIVKYAMRRN